MVVYIYIQWGHAVDNAVDNPWVLRSYMVVYIQYGCLSMVVYIYIHLWLSRYISGNAMDNPGLTYGCLHKYPVMLWRVLRSSMVV